MAIVSASPHIHSGASTQKVMRDVLIALSPALLVATYFFGFAALCICVVSMVTCVVAEYISQKIMDRPVTINDLSALVTGLLLAFCVPPTLPVWMIMLADIVAIVVVKQFFGGIGFNIFNPALIGRAFLLASYPLAMTTWTRPFDGVTTASPLAILKQHLPQAMPSLQDLFLGVHAGSLGEVSIIALALGAAYLFWRKVIDWRIPFAYIVTVAACAGVLGQPVFVHILAGGLVLGAFFMATDYTTSPMTTSGKLVFGIGCGFLTVLIRVYGGYPEGVCYSILIMNMFVPLLDRVK